MGATKTRGNFSAAVAAGFSFPKRATYSAKVAIVSGLPGKIKAGLKPRRRQFKTSA
jgi:hypothetical protein